uniref:Uncharacterized protein n=1 Tax=Lepeophtheirus salmonis TaxID=72036 RepID=A0A0K2UCL3_LEPSM
MYPQTAWKVLYFDQRNFLEVSFEDFGKPKEIKKIYEMVEPNS